MKNLHGLSVLTIVMLTGCGSIPPAKVSYYHPTAQINVKATQTVLCKDDGNQNYQVFSTTQVVFTPNYIAGNKGDTIDFSEFDGFFSDAEIEVDLSQDGRLLGINGSSTGQGKALFSTAVDIALAGSFGLTGNDRPKTDIDEACASFISRYKDKPQTIVRHETFSNLSAGNTFNLNDTGNAVGNFKFLLPSIQLIIEFGNELERRVSCDDSKCDSYPSVTLIRHKPATIVALASNRLPDGTMTEPLKVTQDTFLYPIVDKTYEVPLFAKSLFGKAEAKLQLGEAGEIKKLKYSTSESSSFGEGLSSLTKLISDESEYDKLKSENDLAYEQQRQIACQANPSTTNCK